MEGQGGEEGASSPSCVQASSFLRWTVRGVWATERVLQAASPTGAQVLKQMTAEQTAGEGKGGLTFGEQAGQQG